MRRKRQTPSDEWEVPTRELPVGRSEVVVTVRGNRSIARTLRIFADECERGTVLSLEANYERGDEFVARALLDGLVDPASLNLPGEVRIYADEVPRRSVTADIGPPAIERIRPGAVQHEVAEEITDVQTLRRIPPRTDDDEEEP